MWKGKNGKLKRNLRQDDSVAFTWTPTHAKNCFCKLPRAVLTERKVHGERWLRCYCQLLIARQTVIHAATGRSVKWGVCVLAELGFQVAYLQVLVHILRFCKIKGWRQLLWLWLNMMVSAFHEESVVLDSLLLLRVLWIIRNVQLWCRHCLWTPSLHSTYPSDADF